MPKVHVQNTYSLESTEFCNTPGILRWAINGYKFKEDRQHLLYMFVNGFTGPTITPEIYDKLLKGEIPYTVKKSKFGGTVVFTA